MVPQLNNNQLTYICIITLSINIVVTGVINATHGQREHLPITIQDVDALIQLHQPIHKQHKTYQKPQEVRKELLSHAYFEKSKPYHHVLYDIDVYTLHALCTSSDQDFLFKKLATYRKMSLLWQLHKRGLSLNRRCFHDSTLLDKLFTRSPSTRDPLDKLAHTCIQHNVPITNNFPLSERTITNVTKFCNTYPAYACHIQMPEYLYNKLPYNTQILLQSQKQIDQDKTPPDTHTDNYPLNIDE